MSKYPSYQLRSIQPGNPVDSERMNLMFYHPDVMKAKGYWRDSFDYSQISLQHEISSVKNATKYELCFAVTDSYDRLVGWVWFYRDTRYPLPCRVQKELKLRKTRDIVLQVSYQKLLSTGWPSELVAKVSKATKIQLHLDRPGVIVEGLKLSLTKIRRVLKRRVPKLGRIVIYAFVESGNIASWKVLEKNGFVKYTRKYKYEGVPHDLWSFVA